MRDRREKEVEVLGMRLDETIEKRENGDERVESSRSQIVLRAAGLLLLLLLFAAIVLGC